MLCRRFSLFVLLLFIASGINAQDQLFLAKKMDPLKAEKKDYQNYESTMSFHSVSEDNKYMAFSWSTSKMDMRDTDNMTMMYNQMTSLIDMQSGRIVKRGKNMSLYFDHSALFKMEYADLWDKPFPVSEASKKMIDEVKYSLANVPDLSTKMDIPRGYGTFGGVEQGYFKFLEFGTIGKKPKTSLYTISNGIAQKFQEFELNIGKISSDGLKISGTRTKEDNSSVVVIHDIKSGQLLKEISFNEGSPIVTYIFQDKILIYYMGDYDAGTSSIPSNLLVMNWKTGEIVKKFENKGGNFVINQDGTVAVIANNAGKIGFLDLNKMRIISETQAYHVNDKATIITIPLIIKEGDYVMVGGNQSMAKLVDVNRQKVIADVYVDDVDWAIVAADGRVDGTAGAFEKLEWRSYNSNDEVTKQIPLDLTFERNFTPGLLPLLLDGKASVTQNIIEIANQAPNVRISAPTNNQTIQSKDLVVQVTATPNGDPIRQVELYINNKLVNLDQRGFKTVGTTFNFNISLIQGRNLIGAKAISEKGYESAMDYVEVIYEGASTQSDLYVLAIGVNEYKNPSYNLNYAVADADAFTSTLSNGSSSIFNQSYISKIYDWEANRANVISKLKEFAAQSKPEDVFVLYYAGHGVMDDETQEFYLALRDVTQLYGQIDMLKSNGIAGYELKILTSAIPAQKQLIILDACQSGAAVQTFAKRGAAQEKAIVQLARSAGAVLLASTGSQQFASEFAELGHGVFTYALLQGMNGDADGGSNDGKITVKELEAYLNDQIPMLSDKYKGEVQYPRSWAQGQDFPIMIIN